MARSAALRQGGRVLNNVIPKVFSDDLAVVDRSTVCVVFRSWT